jgi:histidinol-phosphate aminotransferase
MPAKNPVIDLAAEAIRGLAPYEPGKPVQELEREYGVRDAIKLASNENPRGPSPAVREALLGATAELARYPDGACFELRDALAARLKVDPAQLTLGNGSNDVLVLLAETFLTAQQSAVYDQYSFVVYRLAVQACGAEARVAPSYPADHARAYGHDLDAMLALVDESTRIVFIANPNNPTGTWVVADELKSFLRALPDHVIAVLDEAYLEYARQDGEPDSIGWLAEFPRLVIVRTFSKTYGLAGLRVGYGVSSAAIAGLLNRVRQPFNVNSMAQCAAVAALADQDWIKKGVVANQVGIARLSAGLDALGIAWVPSRGNFLLAHLGSAERAAACNEFLMRNGVIVRPVANYGLPAHLRITVGARDEIDRLLALLRRFVEEQT